VRNASKSRLCCLGTKTQFAPSSYVQVLGEGDQAAEEQADDGPPLAERSDVWHLIIGDTLSFSCTDEEDVRREQRDPRQQTEDGGKVD